MSHPLAQVIRYLATGGVITATDVQNAIQQLEALATTDDTLLHNHHARHENGGADEISVAGLSGVLADPQNAGSILTKAIAGSLGAAMVLLRYDGVSTWTLTTDLTGCTGATPAAHKVSHQTGGSDQISVTGLLGVLADPQNADKLNTIPVNTTGAANGYLLTYQGGSFIVAPISLPAHAATHEATGSDPIASLPTVAQKAALASAVTPGPANKYITATELTNAVSVNDQAALAAANAPTGSNPFATMADVVTLPTVNEKAALDNSVAPTAGNPYVTQSVLNAVVPTTNEKAALDNSIGPSGANPYVTQSVLNAAVAGISIPTPSQLAFSNIIAKPQYYFTPVAYNVITGVFDLPINPTVDPVGVVSIPSTLTTLAASPASQWSFSNTGTITADPLTVVQPRDVLTITGTASNNRDYVIVSVAGNIATVSPAPVNEVIATATVKRYQANGQVTSSGFINTTISFPSNLVVSPVVTQEFWYDTGAVGGYSTTPNDWSIGTQVTDDGLLVAIRRNIQFSKIVPASAGFTVARRYSTIVLADTTGAGFTVTLPATPVEGDVVVVKDSGGNSATNNIVVNPNGGTIDGIALSVIISGNYDSLGLRFTQSTWMRI